MNTAIKVIEAEMNREGLINVLNFSYTRGCSFVGFWKAKPWIRGISPPVIGNWWRTSGVSSPQGAHKERPGENRAPCLCSRRTRVARTHCASGNTFLHAANLFLHRNSEKFNITVCPLRHGGTRFSSGSKTTILSHYNRYIILLICTDINLGKLLHFRLVIQIIFKFLIHKNCRKTPFLRRMVLSINLINNDSSHFIFHSDTKLPTMLSCA